MKNKTIVAALAILLAFACIGAKDSFRAPVEVGKTYFISGGGSGVKGKVVSDMGGGWYQVEATNLSVKGPVAVNVNQAFWIEELK